MTQKDWLFLTIPTAISLVALLISALTFYMNRNKNKEDKHLELTRKTSEASKLGMMTVIAARMAHLRLEALAKIADLKPPSNKKEEKVVADLKYVTARTLEIANQLEERMTELKEYAVPILVRHEDRVSIERWIINCEGLKEAMEILIEEGDRIANEVEKQSKKIG